MAPIPVMPTRILVVGGGGREHALAWKLAAEPGVNEVVVAPGSDAIAREPRVRRAAAVDPLVAAASRSIPATASSGDPATTTPLPEASPSALTPTPWPSEAWARA